MTTIGQRADRGHRPGWPSAATRTVALLGWPVRHSLSPVIHNAAFAEQGLELVYVALPTPPDKLVCVVEALAAVDAAGANVTVPHKQAVRACCDRLTAEAQLVGAVNTLLFSADGVVGDNTDALGLERSLRDDLGTVPADPAVVLGTGGAARAAAVALGRLGLPVTVVGRRHGAARDVAALAERCGARPVAALDLDDADAVPAAVEGARLVVNATPLGLAGERLPDAFQRLAPGQIAYDLVYGRAETPFVSAARERGADAFHGLGMLVAQAADSYRRWTGLDPPIATMSAAALAALTAG